MSNSAITINTNDANAAKKANNLSDLASASTAFTNIKQAATTTSTGVVEKSTSAENIAGTSDTVYPTVAGTKEMIAAHGGAWTVIETKTLTSGTTTTFSSISSTYKILKIIAIAQVGTATQLLMTINGQTGASEYVYQPHLINASNTVSGTNTTAAQVTMSYIPSTSGLTMLMGEVNFFSDSSEKPNYIWDFKGYDNTQFGGSHHGTGAGYAATSAAISSITLSIGSSAFAAPTRFTLLGMA